MYLVNGKFLTQRITGVQRVAVELLKELPADEFKVIKPSKFWSNKYTAVIWEQIVLPMWVLKYNKPLISLCNSGPLLIKNQTVFLHDVAFLDNPKWFSGLFAIYYRLLIPKLLARVKKIITCSEFSKDRICEHFPYKVKDTYVVPNGLTLTSSKIQYGLTSTINEPFILSVGSLEPRKNIRELLNVWRNSFSEQPIKLILVGAQNSNFSEVGLTSLPDNVILKGYVSDEQLIQLYKSALFFVYPSLYEGFGLPPLEAMGYGTPVLISNAEALKEVVKDAGMMFDLKREGALETCLKELMSNEPLRKELSKKGLARASNYTWNKSAFKFLEVLKQ